MNQIVRIDETAAFTPEAEQAVLGTLLLHPDSVGVVTGAGGADLFFDAVHADLFSLIADRARQGLLVSPVALAEWAKSHEGMLALGGAGYLVRLAGGGSVSVRQLDHFVSILTDLKAKRDILSIAQDAQAAVTRGEETAVAISGRMEAALMAHQPQNKAKPVSMTAAVTKAVAESYAAHTGEGEQAVHSGIGRLDHIVSGFFPGELVLLGGRPSMGKTAVALSMALNVARQGHGVVICSLEMNPEAMALRAISEATTYHGNAVQYSSMRRGDMTEAQLDTFKQSASEVADLPITFLPREFSDVGALISGAKQARRILGDNMRLFVVDYAQLLTAKAANRYEEITKISLALKGLAGQLNVPVLALSQLSRALEQP